MLFKNEITDWIFTVTRIYRDSSLSHILYLLRITSIFRYTFTVLLYQFLTKFNTNQTPISTTPKYRLNWNHLHFICIMPEAYKSLYNFYKILWNIYDEAFLRKWLLIVVNYFHKKPSKMFDRVPNTLLNPFVPNESFFYPLKTSGNLKIFLCFQGVDKECIGNEWVNIKFNQQDYQVNARFLPRTSVLTISKSIVKPHLDGVQQSNFMKN